MQQHTPSGENPFEEQQPAREQARREATPLLIECITETKDLDAIAPHWEALTAREADAHLFQGYPWLSAWLRHHPEVRPRILTARRGERLTAALPLGVHVAGFGPTRLRALRFIADEDSDYCQALSDPEYPEDLAALWQALLPQKGWDLADLQFVSASSDLSALAQAAKGKPRVYRQSQDIAPALDITKDWRELLPKSERHPMERRLRRLREAGAVTFEVARTPAEVDTMLGQLAPMHVARWQARKEISRFRLPYYTDWLGDACKDLLARGQLYLCRLALDGDPVSIGIYFLYRRRLLLYISSFAESYEKYSPANLLVMAVVENAREQGLAEVHDFGRGGEDYKLHWTQQTQTLDRFLIARASPAGWGALWWFQRAKPFLRRYPHLRTSAVSRVRRSLMRSLILLRGKHE